MSSDVSTPQAVLDSVNALYMQLAAARDACRKAVDNTRSSDEDIADWAYAADQLSKTAEKLRKDCNKIRESAAIVLGTRLLARVNAGDQTDMKPVRGQIGTASIDISMVPKLPRRDSPEFRAIMLDLGFPAEVLDKGIVSANWPGLKAHMEDVVNNGGKLPGGITLNQTYTSFSMRLSARRRKAH